MRVVDAAARVFKEEAASAGRPADAPGTLIVGHDCRQDAHAYAQLAAQVAAAHGFDVKLTQDYRQFDFMSPGEGAEYILPGDEKKA